MKHKWHKEITAYANGAKIEAREINDPDEWYLDVCPYWDDENLEYRIKQKPKYLDAYSTSNGIKFCGEGGIIEVTSPAEFVIKLGKIKLESEEW